MGNPLRKAFDKFRRDLDAGGSVRHVAMKSVRYASELATAKLWLATVNEVGPGVRTFYKPRIDNQGFMSIGGHTLLRSCNVPVELATAPGAVLTLGEGCSLNYGVSIGCAKRITIGKRCRMGPYVMVVDSAFHELLDRTKRPEPEPIVIEDDVWLGAKASVMPGVTIGRGSVVGTGAVVTKDVPPFSVVGGIPAKVLKQLDPEKFVTPK